MWGKNIKGSVGGTYESFETFGEWDIGIIKLSWRGMQRVENTWCVILMEKG
jgi:hypothetical protein